MQDQFTDIATWKFRRRDDEAIRRESQVSPADGQDSGVITGELGIGKMRFKDTVDEFGSLFTAGTVG